MNRMTTTKELTRRAGLAAFAIAMLLSLAAISTPAQAQETKFPINAFGGFKGGVSVGLASGQTVRILIEAADASTGSLSKPSEPDVIAGLATSQAHVKVFHSTINGNLQIADLTVSNPGLHSIDINRDELRVVGEPGTGRIQLWIELVIVPLGDDQARAEVARVGLFAAFEVFDNVSGATTVRGEIKTQPITFTGLE